MVMAEESSRSSISFKALTNSNNRREGESDRYFLDARRNLLVHLEGNARAEEGVVVSSRRRRGVKEDEVEITESFIVKLKSDRERNHPLTRVGTFLNHGVFKIVAKLSQLRVFKDDMEFIGSYEPRFKSLLDFEQIEKTAVNIIINHPKRSTASSNSNKMKLSISITHSLESNSEEKKLHEIHTISNELHSLLKGQFIEGIDYSSPQVISIGQLEMWLSPLSSSRVSEILKNHPNVHFIEKVLQPSFFNKEGVTLAHAVNPNSALKTSPFYDLGIYGTGQTVGLCDTGVDHDHCFFRDSSVSLTTNSVNTNHRKIIAYNRIKYSTSDGKTIITDDKDDVSGHGSHVAGSIVGSMENTNFTHNLNQYHGIAPKAKIHFTDMKDSASDSIFISSDLSVLFRDGYKNGVKIFSNSFGTSASVYFKCSFGCENCKVVTAFDSFNVGDSITNSQCKTLFGSETCCSISNLYTSSPKNLDRFLWENQDAVVLFAAGNDGILSSQGTLTEQANSKNVIAVGASRTTNSAQLSSLNYEDFYTKIKDSSLGFSTPEECCSHSSVSVRSFCCPSVIAELYKNTIAYNENNIASFSSRGPADGGRIKPDLVSVGESIVSAHSDGSLSTNQCGDVAPKEGNSAALLTNSGTSMSCPLVAGAGALIREYLQTHRGVSNPSGPLIKAMIIHSAIPSSGTVSLDGTETQNRVKLSSFYQPNHVEGHGIMSLGSLLKTESGNNVGLTFFQNSFNESSQSFKLCYQVTGSGSWLKSTLAWYDLPSDVSSFVPLINNLDLVVNTLKRSGDASSSSNSPSSDVVVYGGNDLGLLDTVNNVEKVSVESLDYSTSTTSTNNINYVSIAVYMNQLASASPSQPYSLVMTYLNGTLELVDNSLCTYSKDVAPRKFRVNVVAAIVTPIVIVFVLIVLVVTIVAIILLVNFLKRKEEKIRKKSVKVVSNSIDTVMSEMKDFKPAY